MAALESVWLRPVDGQAELPRRWWCQAVVLAVRSWAAQLRDGDGKAQPAAAAMEALLFVKVGHG